MILSNTRQMLSTAKEHERNHKTLRKSKSLITEKTSLVIDMTLKRRSTGCIKQTHDYQPTKEIWRSPGSYEVPNLFGNDCFLLKAEPYNDKNPFMLRSYSTNIKKPWYYVGPANEIPQLPPLPSRHNNDFERRLRKALSSRFAISTLDPRNKYSNFKEIGTGVNGSVVRANHKYKKNQVLAIKRCKMDPDRDYQAAIIRELKIMASAHPNLIRLREISLWRDDVWMVMDLMRCSVFSILCQRGIPEEYTIYIATETLKGVQYLHQKGYIHRDIKCENLLLGWNGEVKLADFGLATRTSKRNFERLGTNKWMAPEVIREENYNEKIDMWSFGITIIEMMDRVPPHYLIKDEMELFSTVLSEPSPTFTYSYPTMYMRGLVAWLLDEAPDSRPSASDVLSEIEVHVTNNLLKCSSAKELARFMNHVLH